MTNSTITIMNGERFEKVKVVEDAFYEVKFIVVDQYSEPIERVEEYMSGKNLIKIFMDSRPTTITDIKRVDFRVVTPETPYTPDESLLKGIENFKSLMLELYDQSFNMYDHPLFKDNRRLLETTLDEIGENVTTKIL